MGEKKLDPISQGLEGKISDHRRYNVKCCSYYKGRKICGAPPSERSACPRNKIDPPGKCYSRGTRATHHVSRFGD